MFQGAADEPQKGCRVRRFAGGLLVALGLWFLPAAQALADDACPRPPPQSEVLPPPDLYSSNGSLNVAFNYNTSVDFAGRTLFCFQTPDGTQSPTLHVTPGDTLTVQLANTVPPIPGGPAESVSAGSKQCGNPTMTLSSVNMHFHGTNTAPTCHSDEVIRTLVNSGETFAYTLDIPKDEPPGLYWYHPHVHGIASASVTGGASGVIVVEGIENLQPAVAGLPQRILVIRDQPVLNAPGGSGPGPGWDVSLNYVPIPYPAYPVAIIKMQSGTREFWRIANASANTIIDLQLTYDGKPQPLQIVALDGVPTGSQDGTRQGTIVTQKDILLPPAGRAEFIVDGPSDQVAVARLVTNAIDGGPAGDSNPARPLAQIVETDKPVKLPHMPSRVTQPGAQRFEGLADAAVTAHRKLFFSETPTGHGQKPDEGVNFFITVQGQQRELYDPNNPPAIITRQGAVEEWTIENRTPEVHDFHMHQIHFLVQAINGVQIPKKKQQFYDTFQVPYWTGVGPFSSIKVKMDFRGAVVGDFVYHCHILEHEDGGMMAIIRVKPPKG
jgi:FtsP/CotA-like multicopper oxidase with cupredoxin domain